MSLYLPSMLSAMLTSTAAFVLATVFLIGLLLGCIVTRLKRVIDHRAAKASVEKANWVLFCAIVKAADRGGGDFDREIIHLLRETKLEVIKLFGASLGHCGSTVLHELAACKCTSVMLLSSVVSMAKQQNPNITIKEIVNLKNGKGASVLHESCFSGVYANVVWLEEQGAEVNYINPLGRSVIHEVLSSPNTSNQEHIISYLLSHCDLLKNEAIATSAFRSAIFNSRDEIVEELMKHAPIELINNTKNDSGDTLLHMAIKEKRTNLCRLLVKGGANLAARNAKGSSPVETAFITAQPSIAAFFLWKGSEFGKEQASSIFRRTVARGKKFTPVGWANVPVPPQNIHMRNTALVQMAELGTPMVLNCLTFEKSMQAYPCTTLFLTISLGGLGCNESEKLKTYFPTLQVITAKALMGTTFTEGQLETMWQRDSFSRPPFSNMHACMEYRAALALLDIIEPYRPIVRPSPPSLQKLCHMAFRRSVLQVIDTSSNPAKDLEALNLVYKREGVAVATLEDGTPSTIDETDEKNAKTEINSSSRVFLDDLPAISHMSLIAEGSVVSPDSYGRNIYSLTNGLPSQVRSDILLDTRDIWGVYSQKSRKIIREQQRICLLEKECGVPSVCCL